MNATVFTQQLKAMSDRLTNLYQQINTSSSPPVLSSMTELSIASERLQIAAQMVYQQNQKLSLANQTLKVESQRYKELLEFIPDACLLTDTSGKIQEANLAAAKLLNLPQSVLINRSLKAFISYDRQEFQTQLRHQQEPSKQEWQLSLQPYKKEAIHVNVFVSHQSANEPQTLRWLLRLSDSLSERLRQRRRVEAKQPDTLVDQSYPLQLYLKGETIPLNSEVIWQVHSGLVKLTTFCDSLSERLCQRAQEVLVGLAGAKAAFGSSLTSLPLYEATALVDTQVSCISLTELVNSNQLKQQLLPQISQRLKQTESLLAVHGQTRVADRLHSLLQLLKHEVGEPVADGIRLSVRLTHEDLASACCTTRVTVTRTLNQLEKQNKLSVDSQHHIILKA
ncbi:PAS domain-containing protein [Tolypothrix sp. VBCCA 56010]|uniref:PAS domain-containing protein n=1 Tax=Tolypothrix sp. VBCCA 56010 TaxID=3137731 RepID=UPI003D7CA5E3